MTVGGTVSHAVLLPPAMSSFATMTADKGVVDPVWWAILRLEALAFLLSIGAGSIDG